MPRNQKILLVALAILAASAAPLFLPAGCSKEGDATRPDTIPPQAVVDLRASSADRSTISLEWTAVGDDGTTGRAAAYDLRYSTSPIDASSWGSATQTDGEPVPHSAGGTETYTLTSLTPGRSWYFALRVADEVPNWSGLSNVGSFATLLPDTIAPAAITDLRVVSSDEGSVTLAWTSVGDDSMTGRVREIAILSSISPIDERTWSEGYPDWRDMPAEPGNPDSATIRWLDPDTGYYFSARALDEGNNWGGMSNAVSGSTTPPVPPAAVTDLTLLATTERRLTIGWTAVGDDGMTGDPVEYEIRLSATPIDETSWATAMSVGHGRGRPPGTPETHETYSSLSPDSTYYLAIKARDDVDAWSALSNVISARTVDTTPPAAVSDLRVSMPGSPAELVLAWTAVGDDGIDEIVSAYDIRYSREPITDASWGEATPISGSQMPRYPGLTETRAVADLDIGRYSFAMRVEDEVGNWSALSNVAVGIVPLRLEAEGYSTSRDLSGDPIGRVSCAGASASVAVDGVGGDGEWIQIPFEALQSICFTDSLRTGGALGLRRTFAIDYVREEDGAAIASDTVTTIPGTGIGCAQSSFDCIWSARIVCLEPGTYFARIRRIDGDPRVTRIDCLDLRQAAD